MPGSAFMLGKRPGTQAGLSRAGHWQAPGPRLVIYQGPLSPDPDQCHDTVGKIHARPCFFEQGLKLSYGPGMTNRRPRARLKKCQMLKVEIYYPQY